ncbi:MAG: hypothetical protein AAF720_06110 [Pseudomonadota bacterium]
MTNDPDEIILPILRDIRFDMAKMSNNMATMTAEMTAMRQYSKSISTLQDHDHADIAELKIRLDRIESRLNLSDA